MAYHPLDPNIRVIYFLFKSGRKIGKYAHHFEVPGEMLMNDIAADIADKRHVGNYIYISKSFLIVYQISFYATA